MALRWFVATVSVQLRAYFEIGHAEGCKLKLFFRTSRPNFSKDTHLDLLNSVYVQQFAHLVLAGKYFFNMRSIFAACLTRNKIVYNFELGDLRRVACLSS